MRNFASRVPIGGGAYGYKQYLAKIVVGLVGGYSFVEYILANASVAFWLVRICSWIFRRLRYPIFHKLTEHSYNQANGTRVILLL